MWAAFLDSPVTDRVLCALVVLDVTAPDPRLGTKAVIESVFLRPIYCHSFMAASTQTKRFLLSFLPPVEPSSAESVRLEVDADKSTKESNFTPSEVAIGLSAYT